MSEFSERHSGSKLIGTTAGFVGYEEGGMLTEKVRRKPYSVVLFDEIEKGNTEIFNLLLQIMEDGVISDGKGRKVNFKNTIIVMTSNIGSEEFTTNATKIGFDVSEATKDRIIDDFEQIEGKVVKSLDEYFSPEFINRIDEIVMFTPLTNANIAQIVGLQLKSVTKMLAQQGITMDATPEAIAYLSEKGYDPQFGARPVKRVIQRDVLNKLSKEILAGHIKTDSIILLDAFDGELVFRNQSELVS